MEYQSIIKSRSIRIKIMRLLSFIPDSIMVKLQYKIKTGRTLNLKNPKRYTEKLQWYKVYYRDSLMAQCVDKYDVRKYVEKSGYASILNPVIGVYDTPDEIDFSVLPEQFVLKDTLGSGGNEVIIVTDKAKINWDNIKSKLYSWIKPKWGKHPGREWVYDQGKSRILIENYISSDKDKTGLIDYKFLCFDGKVRYVYVLCNRILGQGAQEGIFDAQFNLLPVSENDEEDLSLKIDKPKNFDELVICAEKLSRPFPEARIDLYDVDNKIIFGEITFFDSSGYMMYTPDSFDYEMGKWFKLPE